MREMGPLSRSRLLNVARAVEYELQEKRGGLTHGQGGKTGFESGFQYRSSSYYPSGRNNNADGVWVRGGKEGVTEEIRGPKQRRKRMGVLRTRGSDTYLTISC